MRRFIFITFVSALALAAPSSASLVEAPQQVTVSMADIDVSTDRGADRALRRIRDAAENVCDVRAGLQPYAERAESRACLREAMARAVADLGNSRVSVRYRAGIQIANNNQSSIRN